MSNFIVSARKYRPVRFVDVVGQEHVTQTLKNALKNDHLAHAFLFCGPRGVGKTTCARILAKVLNCQNKSADFEPCGVCDSCRSFDDNASFNIMELDAASNNSVDHIRALIEQVRFQPQQGDYKVFIIDEVHMLSQQAFNAFLKTLEEPPSYAIFILATTEKHKIIPTILSRCQIFDFKRIQVPRMVEHLRGICEEENIQADKDALHVIAQKADGALRDALSIFDRIVSFSANNITYQDVITNLNILDYDYYFKVIEAFMLEDVSKIMLLFEDILRKGFDPDIFINGLSSHIRNLLVCKDKQTITLLEASDNLKKRYLAQAQQVSTSFLLNGLNLLNECDIHYKMARNKRLHVEMTLIKLTYINRAVKVAETGGVAIAEVEKKKSEPEPIIKPNKESIEPPKPEPSPTSSSAIPSSANVTASRPSIGGKHSMKKVDMSALLAEVQQDEQTARKSKKELNMEEIKEVWKSYVNQHAQEGIRVYLSKADLQLEGFELSATVGSSLAENALRQETGLMDELRAYFNEPKLALKVLLDKSKAPELPKRKKPLTNKERLKVLHQKNPLIKDVWMRFGLRFDED